MKEINMLMEYFEMNDGEIFAIHQLDMETGEILDQILMEREVAIRMAMDILHSMGDNHAILPAIK